MSIIDCKASAAERIEKPWGLEKIYLKSERLVVKQISVGPGHQLSLQYHEQKDEILFIASGDGLLLGADNKILFALSHGKMLYIPHGAVHRIKAITALIFWEYSTPELSDVVRIADDYGRIPPRALTTIPMESTPNVRSLNEIP